MFKQDKSSKKRQYFQWFGRFFIGVVLFLLILRIPGSSKDIKLLLTLDGSKVWQIILLTLVLNVLATWRLHILFESFCGKSKFVRLLRFIILGRVAGQATSQIIGDLGSRVAYLRSLDINIKTGMLIIVLDKLFEILLFISIGGVFIGTMLFSSVSNYTYPSILAILFFILLGFILPAILSFLGRFSLKISHLQTVSEQFSKRIRVPVILITLAKYTVSAMRIKLIMQLIEIDLSFINVFMGMVAAQLGMLVGITPGGLGFVEAGWAGVLYYYGTSPPSVSKFLIVQRLLITASILLLVFLTLLFQYVNKKYACNLTRRC